MEKRDHFMGRAFFILRSTVQYKNPVQIATITVGILLFILLWWQLAPVQVGGSAAYAIVSGNSMEPAIRRGDLVISHTSSRYRIGDAIVYHHQQIGTVFHRIVARDGKRFVLQGDNNSWRDSYHPTREEIIGKLWLHIPSAGTIIQRLRTPALFALLAGALALLFGTTVFDSTDSETPNARRRQRRRTMQQNTANFFGDNIEELFALFGVIAVAALLLGTFAFTRPIHRSEADNITYEQQGTFSYSAAAPASVYERGVVQTGEPIFRRLIDSVTVEFVYHLNTDAASVVEGTYHVTAEVSHANGWKRRFQLQPATAVSGDSFQTSVTLDLAQVQALVDRFEEQTGLEGQRYTLAIVPEVVMQGTLGEKQFQDSFAPQLTFSFDELQLQLQDDGGALEPATAGMLPRTTSVPNTLSFLNVEIAVWTARQIAVAGLLLALIPMAALGVLMYRTSQQDEAAYIRLKYNPLLLDVADNGVPTGERVIDVASFDNLAKLAERTGQMILCDDRGDVQQYCLQDGPITYRYFANGTGAIQHINGYRGYDPAFLVDLVKSLDTRKSESLDHVVRVTELSVRLARRLGVREDRMIHLRWGAMLHDVGKMVVPDTILSKPGPLSDPEWQVMQRHPEYAYKLFSSVSFLEPALDVLYYHHERWDGTGYPQGLKGEEIPLLARIFSVVDVWDSLRSDRPYREKWSEERARTYLRENAGSQFDPNIVETFLAMDTHLDIQEPTAIIESYARVVEEPADDVGIASV